MTPAVPTSWLGIELRHLAALQAVAEARSFVRAARQLGYTQSAISNQIATLERLVDARLVERARGGSSVALTETGRLLYEHALVLMARLQAARADVAAADAGAAGTLKVGFFQSVGVGALPRVINSFHERSPGVHVDLELGGAERLQQELVAAGLLDLAFVSAPLRVATLASAHLFDDPFVLLLPPGEPWNGVPSFSERPLLALKPCGVQQRHEAALLPRGARARLNWIEDAATIQELVARGCGYGLLPRLAVREAEVSLHVLDGPVRQIHLVWQRERAPNPTLLQFVEAAREEFERLG